MIVLICFKDEETGQILVSHGVDDDTLKNIPIPPEHPSCLGAKFNRDRGEWILGDD